MQKGELFRIEDGVLKGFDRDLVTSDIVVPDGVKKIATGAIVDNEDILRVHIPASVEEIEDRAIAWLKNLKEISVDKDNKRYVSVNNCLIDVERKRLVLGSNESKIPDDGSVEIIGYASFGSEDIAEITLPKSLKVIEERAFSFCRNLTEIIIPAQVESIGKGAFTFCDSLVKIQVDEGNKTYHSYGNCLIHTEQKKLIAGAVRDVVIPCDGSVTAIEEYAFYSYSQAELFIPWKVTDCDESAFNLRSKLTVIHCAGRPVFSYTASRRDWNIKEAWYSLVDENNKDAVVENGELKEYSRKQYGVGVDNNAVVIGDGIVSIGAYAFKDAEGIREVYIGRDVEQIHCSAFSERSLWQLEVLPENKHLYSIDNCIIRKENSRMIIGCYTSKIPADGSVKKIWSAFYECDSLINMEIPEGVEYLGAVAFNGCRNLETLYLPKSLKYVGEGVIEGCDESLKIYYAGSISEYLEIDGFINLGGNVVCASDE